MLSDNIRKYRKEKGFSQEETAVRLHVVRQTVSKWENGISVPDAEVLIDMAELFDVPVSKLLGIEVEQNNTEDLTAELSRLNEELARKNRQENLEKKANEKRGLILFLSLVSMFAALATWNLAHRILGYISLPLALLYVACSMTLDYFKQVTLITVLLWIGIPGVISLIFYCRKPGSGGQREMKRS